MSFILQSEEFLKIFPAWLLSSCPHDIYFYLIAVSSGDNLFYVFPLEWCDWRSALVCTVTFDFNLIRHYGWLPLFEYILCWHTCLVPWWNVKLGMKETKYIYVYGTVIYGWKCFTRKVSICLDSWNLVIVITIPCAQVLQ